MRALRALTAGSLVTAALLVPAAAEARGPAVACGDVVTADLVLTNDLDNCPEVGLVVGADDVTIDLNGHTIDGQEGSAALGIDASAGHSGLTVFGGTIRQFEEGVLIVGGSGHHVHHLSTVQQRHEGVFLIDVVDARVNRLRSFEDCGGVGIVRGGRIRVDHNEVLAHTCAAVAVFESYRIRITRNAIDANPGQPIGGDAAGISVLAGSHGNVVRENHLSGNGFVAIHVEADWNRVLDNDVDRSRIGIILVGDRNLVRANHVAGTVLGCPPPAHGACGVGISYEGGLDNLIEGNVLRRTGRVGISAASFVPETPPARHTTIRGNLVRRAGGDGIRVAPNVRRTLLESNRVVGSLRDGIDVGDPRTTLTRNRAHRNGDLGIEGTPGVRDGGGNRAHDNDDPRQCTHVRCG